MVQEYLSHKKRRFVARPWAIDPIPNEGGRGWNPPPLADFKNGASVYFWRPSEKSATEFLNFRCMKNIPLGIGLRSAHSWLVSSVR